MNNFKLNTEKRNIVAIFLCVFVCFIFCDEVEKYNPWLCLKAIRESYPDITSNFFFDSAHNDWCIEIRGVKLYWADGRLLSKYSSINEKKLKTIISYFYPEEIPSPEDYSEYLIEKLKPDSLIKARKAEHPPNYLFYSLIYNGKTRSEIIKQLQQIKFFGRDVWVHRQLAEKFKRIEKKILELRNTNIEIKKFVKNIGYCCGFNWRVIADSGKLSNHCWGSAIDILPKNYRNKKIYWFWEAVKNDNWMKILPNDRWSPPKAVIDIFEYEGFIWGGKWTLWDNMHFEYRPELLYIRDFILGKERKNDNDMLQVDSYPVLDKVKPNHVVVEYPQTVKAILETVKIINAVQNISDELTTNFEKMKKPCTADALEHIESLDVD